MIGNGQDRPEKGTGEEECEGRAGCPHKRSDVAGALLRSTAKRRGMAVAGHEYRPRMIVRRASAADFPAWAAMRRRLWPGCEPEELEREPPLLGLVAEAEDRLIGFAEASVRNYAEGAPAGPAAYLEGIWVEPEHRRRGVGRALLAAVERWARERGLSHLGSDALLDNDVSHRWHSAAGFAEIERLVVFGKPLG